MRRFSYFIVVLVSLFAVAVPAQAATIIVNSTADNLTAGDGNCTLREAIRNANTDSDTTGGDCVAGSGADTINVPAGTYTLTLGPAGDDAALSGDLDLTGSLTITGAGAATTIIQACTVDQKTANCPGGQGIVDRVFNIRPGANVLITGVTVRNGSSGTVGGGILNSQGTLTLTDSIVSGNKAFDGGGGIFNDGGTATVTNSTISGNSGPAGGGIWSMALSAPASLTLINSTVSGNRTAGVGGGIRNTIGTATLNNSTISNNTGSSDGGGIWDDGAPGVVNVKNTIIAGNLRSPIDPDDCAGTLNSQGHNLIQETAGCTIAGDTTGNITGVDPLLGPLANNGGLTQTHGLMVGSPAIDAGNPAVPGSGGNACEATDQRGEPRTVAGGGDGDCDIGAFEGVVFLPLDHFLSYKGKVTTGFQAQNVTLKDQFDDPQGAPQNVTVKKPASLLNPADKNGEGINEPNIHLMGYKIKQEALHEPVTAIIVKNQFHPEGLSFDTIKPDRLLVPTLKDLVNPVTLPDPFEPSVDHFKCYKVKVTPGTSKLPKGIQASVKDQFNEVAKLFDIKKPSRLCNPVDKNGEGIKNEAAHLMCYKVKPATKHTPVTGIHVNNQFGPEQLDTIKEEELCVPSVKTLPTL